ncbi:MAG: hypothetical protein U0793_29455 [Gemmataceae bacterium]
MSTLYRRFGLLALSAGVWLAIQGAAHAQFVFRTIPSAQQVNAFNPFWRVAPGVSQAQYLATVRAYAATAATIPPYLYGYNPYPSPVINTGPVINPYNPYPYGPLYGGANPYTPGYGGAGYSAMTNPYMPGTSAYSPYTNPYTPGTGYDSGYYPPYPYGGLGSGGVLYGSADSIRAIGSTWTSAEQARLMREQALQAHLETKRKKFDLDMYIKQNTPTFTEEQARIAAITLKRIQNSAMPGEISSGKSLNILLDDMRKFPGKKVGDMPPMPEDVLTNLNVTAGTGGASSTGLIRDGKLPAWPTALQDIIEPTERARIAKQVAEMVERAKAKEAVDPAVLTKLRKTLDDARDKLGDKINDIATSEYLNAKRFLTDLDLARKALETGDAARQLEFETWAKAAPRTPQDLADYMVRKGLKIAPAVASDDAAYRAAHSALAALDIQMNATFALAAPDYKE